MLIFTRQLSLCKGDSVVVTAPESVLLRNHIDPSKYDPVEGGRVMFKYIAPRDGVLKMHLEFAPNPEPVDTEDIHKALVEMRPKSTPCNNPNCIYGHIPSQPNGKPVSCLNPFCLEGIYYPKDGPARDCPFCSTDNKTKDK